MDWEEKRIEKKNSCTLFEVVMTRLIICASWKTRFKSLSWCQLAVSRNLIHSSHRPLWTWYLLAQHVYSTALPLTLLFLILGFLSLFLSFLMSFAFLVGVPWSLCNKHMSVLEILFKAFHCHSFNQVSWTSRPHVSAHGFFLRAVTESSTEAASN